MSNEKCPFVVGSGYQTRDGRPALCIGMNPSGDPNNKVVFSVGEPGDSYVYATGIDGSFLGGDSCDDLLQPAPKLVERWIPYYGLSESTEEGIQRAYPNARSYHKIMVPE